MFTAPRAVLATLFAVALAGARAHAATPEDELIGLWAYGTAYGPMLQGELTIERKGDAWRGTFGGLEATIEAPDDTVVAVFPEGVGNFRGKLLSNGRAIDGFWLRRAITEDPRYPGGSSQGFSTPLLLSRAGENRWTGEVVPLKDRLRQYLKIFRNEDGMLLGAFRDPYMNRTGGASRFRVTRDGDKVAFSQPNDVGEFDVWFEGTFLRDPERLQVEWSDVRGTIELARREADDINVFLPRPVGEPAYVYRKPEATKDGWQAARGRDVGIDEATLARAVQKIIVGDPAGRRPSLVHSMLIARHGRLVLEEYFFGYDRDTPHDMRSAGKTFASVMLGAAMLHGVDISPDTKICDALARRAPFANPDPRKAKITLAHLMTHTSGLACNDNDEASPGNEDTLQSQTAQPDWWKYTLDLPMAHEPGGRYAYCSANMNLVGGALTVATKTWLPEFFDRAVARPLGFGRYYWNLTPTDDGYLGGGAFLRPRDLLKVGQAYLDGGQWRGQRIVSQEWVAQSTAPRIRLSPETTGLSADEFGEYYGESEDAYAWHLGRLQAGERTYRTYEASGNGGQLLIVAPELDLVVVFTGGNYGQGGIWSRWRDELVGAEIVATMKP
jgi:CubicO group peptidase (beta-lactamase class C family)